MSKIDELIQQYCPEGVEFVPLNSISTLLRGKVISKDYIRDNEGDYPVYSSQSANDGILGRINTFMYDGKFLTWTTDGAYAGTIFRRSGKFNITNVCGLVKVSSPDVNIDFLYYWLYIEAPKYVYRGMGNPKLMSNVMGTISVPLPPLPIQEEIVRILDTFTELQTTLQSELEAELQARQQQYQYYRDQLLTFEDRTDVTWKKLSEVATEWHRGAGIKKDEVYQDGMPCIRYGEIHTTYNIWFDKCVSHTDENQQPTKKYAEYGDVLFAITSEDIPMIGNSVAYLGKEKILVGGDIVVMKHNQNPKYMAYALSTSDAVMQKGKGKVKSKVVHTNVPSLKEIVIPLPSLEEQEKIASILDKFNSLVNDLSKVLPTEIGARKQQYEYYRDKLLTFKKKAV